MGTVPREQCLANYEARLCQEDSTLPVPNVMDKAGILCGAGHGRAAQSGADGTDDSPLVG